MRSFRSFATTPPKMLFQPINDQGGGNYRMMLPASLLRRGGYAVTQAHPMALTPESLEILSPDVLAFQLFQTEKQIERIKAYKKTLPHGFLVYEIDDLFWAVPESSYHHNNPLLPSAKSNIRTAAKLCDAMTVTTPQLAERMKALTSMNDIRVVPNLVPRQFINAALTGRRSSDAKHSSKPRVGWAGGIGHAGDLKIIAEVMKEIGDEVQWVFFGMLPEGVVAGDSVEYYQGVPFAEYPRQLGNLNLDLALAPLENNEFNICKSDLRALEYGAAGYPVLGSNVGTYADCPIATCANTVDAWVKAIRHFVADAAARDEYAEKLHNWVVIKRCLDDQLLARIRAYLPPGSEPFVPMASTGHMGQVVSVGLAIEGLDSFHTIPEAWQKVPGADILYVRPDTGVTAEQAARLIQGLGNHASISPLNNDGMYPAFGKFTRIPPAAAMQIDMAAAFTKNEPIQAPFPAGPCVLLAGHALARFGLPDDQKFGSAEYAMADWGARCLEGGRSHATAADVFVATGAPLVQPKAVAQATLEHIAMWTPGFAEALQSYQNGADLARIREDIDLAYYAVSHEAPPVNDYQTWYDLFESINVHDRAAMEGDTELQENGPIISIVCPTFNTNIEYLSAAIESVLDQTYSKWELLIADDASTDEHVVETIKDYAARDSRIKWMRRESNGHICNASNSALDMATGDWVVFLDHDDTLAPQALYVMAKEMMAHPEAKFVYSDSDKIGMDGKLKDPYFTPDFSYELLLAQNYVTHLCAYRLPAVKELGGLKIGMEGSQDWDLVLRYLDAECEMPPNPALVRHVPYVLYHWRESDTSTSSNIMAKPYALEAGRKAVMAHLARIKQSAFLGPHPVLPIFNLVRFVVPDPAPRVTIIIPTKNNAEQLDRCLSSILGQTLYPNYNIMVLDNGSTDKRTRTFLRQIAQQKNIRVVHMPGQFNYAEMNNRAVKMTDAKLVCLMNDDVEVIERTWLADMVGLAVRPKVGAVGAKLIYPNDTVQQAGIMFSPFQPPGGSALHLWQQLPMHHPGQTGRAVITQPYIAVTGACMVIRREVYQEMNGMDAVRFPVDWNDVDLCLRLHKAGYRNILSAQSYMRHHEGQTKKKEGAWTSQHMLADEQKLLALHSDVRDPYVNARLMFHPHLTMLMKAPFEQPWATTMRPRQLLVNGSAELMLDSFKQGNLPFNATIEGHYLVFTTPTMPNVRPLDLRMSTDQLEVAISKLGIDEIIFCGIGDGTLGAVGFFAALADNNWRVSYKPIPEAETDNALEYYDPTGWRATWQKLLDAEQRANALTV